MSDDAELKAIVDRVVAQHRHAREWAEFRANEQSPQPFLRPSESRRLPLWERVACYVLDTLTRVLDAFTRKVRG